MKRLVGLMAAAVIVLTGCAQTAGTPVVAPVPAAIAGDSTTDPSAGSTSAGAVATPTPTAEPAPSSVAPDRVVEPEPETPEPETSGSSAPRPGTEVDPAEFAARLQASNVSSANGHMVMDVESSAGSVRMEITMSGMTTDSPAMEMVTGEGYQTYRVRSVDGQVYLSGGAVLRAYGLRDATEETWALIDPATTDPDLRSMLDELDLSSGTNATWDQSEAFAIMAQDVREVGPTTIPDGRAATEYSLLLDAGALLATYGMPAPDDLPELPLTMWLDEADRPIAMALTMEFDGEWMDLQITMDQFDTTTPVQAPEPSVVVTLS